MFDFFKELVSVANSRVRSPILGSITLVFLSLNWKEFFYVLFAKVPVQVRLSFFDVNTDRWSLLYLPLLVGTGLAILYPWINLASIQLAKVPLRALKKIQGDEDHLRQMHSLENAALIEKAKAGFESERAEYEKEYETRLIAAAERLKEAQSISPEAALELQKDRESNASEFERSESQIIDAVHGLSEYAKAVLVGLASDPDGEGGIEGDVFTKKMADHKGPIRFVFRGDTPAVEFKSHRREISLLDQGLRQLLKFNFVESVDIPDAVNFHGFSITELGYQAFELLAES